MLLPPVVQDHGLDPTALEHLLHDTWAQFVARQVRHRKALQQLQGLDLEATQHGFDRLTPHHLAITMSLHDGSFLAPSQQAKFDSCQTGLCPSCGTPDEPSHWLSCPRFADVRAGMPELTSATHTAAAPQHFTQHLLVARSLHATLLKSYFATLPLRAWHWTSTFVYGWELYSQFQTLTCGCQLGSSQCQHRETGRWRTTSWFNTNSCTC